MSTPTVDSIAAALNEDAVFVDPAAAAELNPTLLQNAQAELEAIDFDVYVIVVDLDRPDIDMAADIAAATGDEGAYVLINSDADLYAEPHFSDPTLAAQVGAQLSNAREEWNPQTPALTKLGILLDYYADPQERDTGTDVITGQEAPGSDVVEDSAPSTVPTLLFGGIVLLIALAVVAGFLFRSFGRARREAKRRKRFELPGELVERVDSLQRAALRTTVNEHAATIADTVLALRTEDLGAADAERVSRALDAYQAARDIAGEQDAARLDLAGARVLLRQAEREVAEAGRNQNAAQKSRRKQSARQRPASLLPPSLCTVNPLHGPAEKDSRVTGQGESVSVPVCADCRDDLQAGRTPQWIYDGDRPYVEGDSVWARTLFGAIGTDLVTELHRHRP